MLIRICSVALTFGLLAACSGASNQQQVLPDQGAAVPQPIAQLSITPRISHITVVIMENYDYEQIIGNASAPYTNAFARANALFTNSHAITHPSEPNYLALFSGSTQGVTTDVCPLSFGAANVTTELLAHGYTFQGYAENWPASGNPCYGTPASVSSHYLYWRKHAPWTDFTNVAYRTYGHAYIGPGTVLTGSVNFIVPNICDDQHDCSIATGDAWLSHNVPAIQNYDSTHNGLLIVTYDEGQYSSTNHIVTIASGGMVVKGSYTQSVNHYSLLRLLESNFGLPLLGASATAAAMPGIGATPTPAPSGSYSFVKNGTVGGVSPTYLTVQFGSGCGWMHVYVNSGTVYSPSTWRPALNDSITVYGSGSCSTGSVTAAQIVKL